MAEYSNKNFIRQKRLISDPINFIVRKAMLKAQIIKSSLNSYLNFY